MKLNKETPKEMDLEQTVYEKIADEFRNEVPVIPNVPKGEKKVNIHFDILERIKVMAETICLENRKRFPTPTHFYRSAFHLGSHILYHIFWNQDDRAMGNGIYKTLQKVEKSLYLFELLESILNTSKRLILAKNLNLLTEKKYEKHINEIIDSLPEEFSKTVLEHIENQKRTLQITDITGISRKPGRPKAVRP